VAEVEWEVGWGENVRWPGGEGRRIVAEVEWEVGWGENVRWPGGEGRRIVAEVEWEVGWELDGLDLSKGPHVHQWHSRRRVSVILRPTVWLYAFCPMRVRNPSQHMGDPPRAAAPARQPGDLRMRTDMGDPPGRHLRLLVRLQRRPQPPPPITPLPLQGRLGDGSKQASKLRAAAERARSKL
jgi:hypothetical protein